MFFDCNNYDGNDQVTSDSNIDNSPNLNVINHANNSLMSNENSLDPYDFNDNLNLISNENLREILRNYEHIFAKHKYDVGNIRIELQRIRLKSDLPISLRPYRTSQKEQTEINSQIQKLLEAGLIRESNSPYSAPVTLVMKRDEGKKNRLCIDYRKLNSIVKNEAEPLPRIDDILDKLSNAQYFTTLDLASGFWHIPIHPSDIEKLAFTTDSGLFEWTVLPFGVKTGPSIFNRTIRRVLNKYKIDFARHYFDDIIIFSSTFEEHLQHLTQLFHLCEQENIKLKLSKCKFAQNRIKFLGYEIFEGTITPANANIETIKKLKPPTNVKELQRFLGSINVYHKFIHKYAEIRQPLNKLLKKNAYWEWDSNCQNSFQKLKDALISKPILRIYDPTLPLHMFVDASQSGVGAVLKQPDKDDFLHPIAYYSRALRSYEQNYFITELECLAIVDTLDKFYHYFHGTKFTIHTDHASLVWLKSIKNLRGRLFRWSLKLSMFDYTVEYQKGSTNIEADMLSRNPISHFITPISLLLEADEIIEKQKEDNVCGKNFKTEKGIIIVRKKGYKKIVVPFSLRRKILNQAHEKFGHPGIQKMLNIISPNYYWSNMTHDITQFVKHCDTCQKNKKSHQKKFGLLQSMPATDQPFEYLAVDTVGGFNYYNSPKKYLHLIIDYATRYVWGFSSKNVTAEAYVNCLKQVFNIQVPQQLLSDRNGAFTSSRFKKFLRNYKIKQRLTTAHHPQCNGKIERANQNIVTRLKCKVNTSSTRTPWTRFLEQVIKEYNNTPHSVTTFPPAYLLHGQLPYNSPIDQDYYPPVQEALKIAKEKTAQHHLINKRLYDLKFQDKSFNINDLVIYEEFHYPNTRKLTSPYSGPYRVVRKLSDVNYEIDKHNSYTGLNTEVVHISKLRPYNSPDLLKLSHEV